MTLPRTDPATRPPTLTTLSGLATRLLSELVEQRRLVSPRDVFITRTHVSLYFSDAPLSYFVDWLSALGVVDVQCTDNLAGDDGKPVELTGLLATGDYRGTPLLLHAVTEVRVPRYPSTTDLRAAAEADAHLRDAAARMRASAAAAPTSAFLAQPPTVAPPAAPAVEPIADVSTSEKPAKKTLPATTGASS